MKQKLFYLFALIILFGNSCSSKESKEVVVYKSYPKFEAVVEYFFDNYSIKNYEDKDINFKKDKIGWHIEIRDIRGGHRVLEEFLIWEKGDKKYKEIDLDNASASDENQSIKDEYLRNKAYTHLYNCCPYFGYQGWEEDVINDFKDIDNYSDSLLCGVASAYSNYASNLLTPSFDYANQTNTFNLCVGNTTMTDKQLAYIITFGEG